MISDGNYKVSLEPYGCAKTAWEKFLDLHPWANHVSISWARGMESNSSRPILVKCVLILLYWLRLVLPQSQFPWRFNTKILYIFSSLYKSHMPPSHHPFHLSTHMTFINNEYKTYVSVLRSCLPPYTAFSFVGSNIFLGKCFGWFRKKNRLLLSLNSLWLKL